jgi:hypothetical protein
LITSGSQPEEGSFLNPNQIHYDLVNDSAFMREWKSLCSKDRGGAVGRNVILRAAKARYGDTVSFPIAARESVQLWLNSGVVARKPDVTPQPAQLKKESTPVKFFETINYVNGRDVKSLKPSEIVSAIAAKEAEVESLKKAKAQPKMVLREIAKIEGEIAGLTAFLDSIEPRACALP